jgi:hypothetical protein
MMLDVDFALCTDIRAALSRSPGIKQLLRTREAALVVPAFEYKSHLDGRIPSQFPRDKAVRVYF